MLDARRSIIALTGLGASAALAMPAAAQDGDFSGPYVAVQADYLWSSTTPSGFAGAGDAPLTGFDKRSEGGSATIGYDWQADRIVFGLFGSVTVTDLGGATPLTTLTIPENEGVTIRHHGFATDLSLLATLGGRAGVEVTKDVLVYVAGGATLGNLRIEQTGTGAATSRKSTPIGYSASVGLEVKVTPHISVGASYTHFDLGDQNFAPNGFGGGKVGVDGDRASVGLSFRF